MQWRQPLQSAGTVEKVQEVMELYVSQIAAGDKLGLPAACRSVLRDVDIAAGAATLLREELRFEGDADTRNLLHEISHTFAAAANRMALLESGAG